MQKQAIFIIVIILIILIIYFFKRKNPGDALNKHLQNITEAFEKENLTYWVDYGTLLGGIRDKNIIPWTNDLDFSILKVDEETLVKALKNLPSKYGWKKVYKKALNNIGHVEFYQVQFPFDFKHADIALRIRKNGLYVDPHMDEKRTQKLSLDEKDVFPLDKVLIRDKFYPAPSNIFKIVEKYYGKKWRTPDKKYHA